MPVGADDLIGPKVGDGAGAIKRNTFVNKTRAAVGGGPYRDYGSPKLRRRGRRGRRPVQGLWKPQITPQGPPWAAARTGITEAPNCAAGAVAHGGPGGYGGPCTPFLGK